MSKAYEPQRRPSLPGSPQSLSPPSLQQLPSVAALTSGSSPGNRLSVGNDLRDSGTWSGTNSNHSSMHMTLPPIDSMPGPRTSGLRDPLSGDGFASQYSPSIPHHHPSPSASTFLSTHTNHSTTSIHTHSSYAQGHDSPNASRRSSFDTSRLGNLTLSSPATGTPSASQVSLNGSLRRSGTPPAENHGYQQTQRLSNGYGAPYGVNRTNSQSSGGMSGPAPSMYSAPFPSMNGHDSHTPSVRSPLGPPGRTAPPIVGSSRYPYPHPNAPSPTKGYPYAFPDPGEVAAAPLPSSRDGPVGRNSGGFSANEVAQSFPGRSANSSQSSFLTTGTGQHDARASASSLHHHHLKTSISSQGGMMGDDGQHATPYSRTPELRVSHKLAERKRRKEMKDLFDDLRMQLPQERASKSSKWEVLTKAIDHITNLNKSVSDYKIEIDQLKRERDHYRQEAVMAREQVNQPMTNGDPQPSGSPPPPQGMQGIEISPRQFAG